MKNITPIDKETLESLYLRDGLTTYEIAEKLHCSKTKVLNWLHIHNMPIRPSSSMVSDTLRFTKKLSLFELGWISALIDGEGHIMLMKQPSRTNSFSASVGITNTSKELLEKVRDTLGVGSIIYNKYSGEYKAYRDLFRIELFGRRDILALLEQIMPYLIIKRKQATLLIDYCKLRIAKQPYTEQEYAIYAKIRELNHRPIDGSWRKNYVADQQVISETAPECC